MAVSVSQAIKFLKDSYTARGYRPFRMGRFEEYDLYIQNKEFLMSDRVITFPGRDGQLMALKPDVTLSIVKNASQEKGVVNKVYYNESVYRADVDTHDFRELTQMGLECIGDLDDYDIVEVVCLAQESLALLGTSYILDISHMGLLEAVLVDVPQIFRSEILELLQQKNTHELQALFAKNELSPKAYSKLLCLLNNAGKAEVVLPVIQSQMDSKEEMAALCDLKKVISAMDDSSCVRIDFSVANKLSYYNGLVFRGYLAGVPDAVLSGGQYDRLLTRMGRKSKAIGFAVYLDQLERLMPTMTAYEVDAILLYDDNEDVLAVKQGAKSLSYLGSVLVAKKLPTDYIWKAVYRCQNREVRFVEGND